MKRIVISGAGGFLGRNLIDEAGRRNIPVLAISTHPETICSENVETVRTEQFLEGDIRLSGGDVFIHCMFPSNADGVRMAEGLKNVYAMITAAKESGAGAFINVSSQSVYASKRLLPADEHTQLSLETPYAVGKYSTEAFSNEVFKNTPHTSVRLASLLGIGYDLRIINRMVSQALKGNPLKVVGGMQRYGFLDVRDGAAGLICMAQTEAAAWKPVYNLGRMESITLLEAVEMIVRQLQVRGIESSYSVEKGTDERNSAVDAGLFMRDFSWKSTISLEQTVADIIDSKMAGEAL